MAVGTGMFSKSQPTVVDNTSKPTGSWACTFHFPRGQAMLDSTALLQGAGSIGLCIHMHLSSTCEMNNPNKIVAKCAPVLESACGMLHK